MELKIIRLPEDVINQIAAGEVVENPASIMKELIENSLDAQSTSIRVVIEKGGFEYLKIEDDGVGMSPEDALLSVERHATSKIRSIEDLNELTTMGFRGEALASIASVSEFSMKTSDGKEGTWISLSGGRFQKRVVCARNQGTTIEVSSLFFNVPARKKFQKSVASSVTQMRRLIETISLAHPSVSFSFQVDGMEVFKVEEQTQEERIQAVLGPFDHRSEGRSVFGFFKGPQEAKTHRRDQFIFVNLRPVVSPLISKAVKIGYGTRLSETMHPAFTLFINLDPKEVDVNVHPQKREVRFSDDSRIFREVEKCVEKAFFQEMPLQKPIFFQDSDPFRMHYDFVPSQVLEEEKNTLPFLLNERALFVMDGYLFLEKEDLLLVDLRGAKSRILYEEMKKSSQEKQTLLFPLEVEIQEDANLEEIQALGIECRWIGRKKIAVDALPILMDVAQFPLFLSSWEEEKQRLERASVRFCRQLKRGFSLEEGMLLWRRLQTCQDSLYDPMGRKIWKKIETKDVEGWLRA